MCTLHKTSIDPILRDDMINSEKWSSSKVEQISHLSCEPYYFFIENYMLPNKPCIFTAELTDNWKSRKKWVTPDGQPNLNYLSSVFGSSTVPVVICDDKDFSCCDRKSMLFANYIEQHMQTNSTKSDTGVHFYLKDWHFNRAYPEYKAYSTPKYFCEDWLNEFCANENDDFQFVYIGSKGTWTPLHADVYGSYSWSANICGRKRWLLFPPGQEKLLRKDLKKLPHMLAENEISHLDVLHFDFIQEPGEIIFVPSGWYHQVWNIEDTISINHNWFNRYNILYIWNCLNIAATEVEHELSDLKEFDDWQTVHQALLKAHHGMNFCEFFKMLNFVFDSRTSLVLADKENSKQAVFDLTSVRNVCRKMLSNTLPEDLLESVENLHAQIINFLSEFN